MLNPKRDFVLIKEVMFEEEEASSLLDSEGNKVRVNTSKNNGTTRYGYVVAVGPENKDVAINELVHFGPHCGEIVGYGKEDFILLQRFEVTMSEDNIPYVAPPQLTKPFVPSGNMLKD